MSPTAEHDDSTAGRPSGGARTARHGHRARRGEGQQLREDILDATEELLVTTGDEQAVSIRAVAKKVGRTSPAIYLHFDDKDSLVHAVCDRLFDRLADRMDEALADIDDAVERVRAAGHAYVAFATEHPAAYRVLLMNRSDWTGHEATMDGLRDSIAFQALYRNVAAAYEADRFVGPGPELTSLALWMGMHGLASLLIAKPSFEWPDQDVLVDLLCEQSLRGLLPDDQR